MVSFLYFANAMKWQLFENPVWNDEFLNKRADYLDALKLSDYLLADGIALQLFSQYANDKRLDNLNGTDFIPYFLENVTKNHRVSVYLYQCYDPTKGKWIESLDMGKDALIHKFWVEVPRSDQCLYTKRWEDFSFDLLSKAIDKDTNNVKIFLNCTWTPFQENWSKVHHEFFMKNSMMIFNAGGLIDFISWFETRAPERVVKARVLETFRRVITKPKKNLHKFLSMFGVIRFLWKPIKVS